MNINAANLKVGLAASTDPARTQINTIHITRGYTEATNGHMLARVSLPFQYDPEEVPIMCPTGKAEDIIPFAVMAKPAMAIKPMKSNRRISMPCIDGNVFIDVTETNSNGTAAFSSTDLESTISPKLTKLDGDYPDTDKVIPTDEPDFKVLVSIEHLQTLLTIAKATGAETVLLSGESKGIKPLCLDSENINTMQTFKGILMPIRL